MPCMALQNAMLRFVSWVLPNIAFPMNSTKWILILIYPLPIHHPLRYGLVPCMEEGREGRSG